MQPQSAEERPPPAAAPLFTIVCASHRPDVLERWLLPSVRAQRAAHELRVVDTRGGAYPSCAAALNAGARGARGRYLMFVHHDVGWDAPDLLADLAAHLDRLPDAGVAGVVGSRDRATWPYRATRNAVIEGEPPGRLVGDPVAAPEPVRTLDELMLIVPADRFAAQPFDERACDDWHLYGTDYALTVAAAGLQAYVLPVVVRHQSPGVLSDGFYRSLANVRRKHRRRHRRIITTFGTWDTWTPARMQKLLTRGRRAVDLARGLILRAALRLPAALSPPAVRRRRAGAGAGPATG